ncbi:unnamed protein product [Calypogeia fissa]
MPEQLRLTVICQEWYELSTRMKFEIEIFITRVSDQDIHVVLIATQCCWTTGFVWFPRPPGVLVKSRLPKCPHLRRELHPVMRTWDYSTPAVSPRRQRMSPFR